ncbi:MAG TPA: hypothetical protein PLV23_09365 [Sedimentibacter sp.]|jgi:uncharacterized protein YxeA|nr:hypothetical protein [Sedimentibacter sp.]
MRRILIIIFIVIVITIIFAGCTSMGRNQAGNKAAYKKISAETISEMLL